MIRMRNTMVGGEQVLVFAKILRALVDSGAGAEAIRSGAIGALESAQKQLQEHRERQQRQEKEREAKEKAQLAQEDNGNTAATNTKKFNQQIEQVKAIKNLVQEGILSEEMAEQKIKKILGIKHQEPQYNKDGTAVIYPLGGCCNYAPCLFPDGCCPDGWYDNLLLLF